MYAIKYPVGITERNKDCETYFLMQTILSDLLISYHQITCLYYINRTPNNTSTFLF